MIVNVFEYLEKLTTEQLVHLGKRTAKRRGIVGKKTYLDSWQKVRYAPDDPADPAGIRKGGTHNEEVRIAYWFLENYKRQAVTVSDRMCALETAWQTVDLQRVLHPYRVRPIWEGVLLSIREMDMWRDYIPYTYRF